MKPDTLPVPVRERPAMAWGSDAIAEVLSRLDIPYLSCVPGASYRGLHDSLVNYLGNSQPEILLCLHEEHAVAVAHGYAKVTGRPMAVALHSNVGLMHATMAIFNAYCDRVPMLMLGATGPVDATRRRPWIDWIHTSADQGALIRNYCKWDDQPGSVEAAVESLIRADAVTRSYPAAPTYVCLDSQIQEAPLTSPVDLPQLARFRPPAPPAPSQELTRRVLDLMRAAQHPLVLVGRCGRDLLAWQDRVRLAEKLGACALTDRETAAVFPTNHRLHPATAAAGARLTPSGRELLRSADVVLSLDWIDLAGTLRTAFAGEVTPTVISCSGDGALHNGWSKDHFALPATDVAVSAHPDALVAALVAELDKVPAEQHPGWPAAAGTPRQTPAAGDSDELAVPDLAAALQQAVGSWPVCWISVPHGWDALDIAGPLDYLGGHGGGGLGAGPGVAVGAALALQETGRLPVAVLGDGDYLMGGTALWTATHYRIPLLVVVSNNRSYGNDEAHQERMARMRDRPVANRGVGLHLRDPDPDLAAFADSQGARGYGPVREPADLKDALERAVADVTVGEVAVVDVHVNS